MHSRVRSGVDDPGLVGGRLEGEDGLHRICHFGLNFVSAHDVRDVVKVLLAANGTSGDPDLKVVVTPNVDQLVKLDRNTDAVAAEVIRCAKWVLPDGQPIVWASKFLGQPLATRLSGSSLVALLWPEIIKAQRRVLVIAGSSQVTTRVEAEGRTMHAVVAPTLSLSSPTDFSLFVEACCQRARKVKPEFVFVGLGFPKQCNVIHGMHKQWPTDAGPPPLFLAVGGSFEMYYRVVRRAPEWMQRVGLEWFFRFLQEPRRLFRRYFVDDLYFVYLFIREIRARKTASKRQSPNV